MIRSGRRFAPGLVFAVAALLAAAPALSDPPASLPDSTQDRAQASFERFAGEWMQKVQRGALSSQKNPTIRPGAEGPMVSYRGYDDDYSVELRPTGHASAPYVGILRYSEQIHTCTDAQATQCSVTSTIPVTEIFRFQNGNWVY